MITSTAFSLSTWFLVFFTYIVIDILYATWFYQVTEVKPVNSALTAMVLYGLIAFGVTSFVSNPVYITAVVLGAGIGTYGTVKWKEVKNKRRIMDA